jgi:peptidoglycan/xylan/chitin deacetylase (PgdA/CDA1 family)
LEPTPIWAFNPAGAASVPILLYHHISDEAPGTRYYVTPAEFKKEMEDLQRWGYTTIPISLLVDALKSGASLPPRPIVITFDDGHQSVYDNAFPIMKKLGMVGVVYIVANRLQSKDFMDVAELKEMIDSGWEVGAHSMTHADLTLNHGNLRSEILDSRLTLESALGVHVPTFAYPFGAVDSTVAQKTADYGFKAAVGLGRSWEHTLGTLYYLSRIEVYGGLETQAFAALLPWHEPLIP